MLRGMVKIASRWRVLFCRSRGLFQLLRIELFAEFEGVAPVSLVEPVPPWLEWR